MDRNLEDQILAALYGRVGESGRGYPLETLSQKIEEPSEEIKEVLGALTDNNLVLPTCGLSDRAARYIITGYGIWQTEQRGLVDEATIESRRRVQTHILGRLSEARRQGTHWVGRNNLVVDGPGKQFGERAIKLLEDVGIIEQRPNSPFPTYRLTEDGLAAVRGDRWIEDFFRPRPPRVPVDPPTEPVVNDVTSALTTERSLEDQMLVTLYKRCGDQESDYGSRYLCRDLEAPYDEVVKAIEDLTIAGFVVRAAYEIGEPGFVVGITGPGIMELETRRLVDEGTTQLRDAASREMLTIFKAKWGRGIRSVRRADLIAEVSAQAADAWRGFKVLVDLRLIEREPDGFLGDSYRITEGGMAVARGQRPMIIYTDRFTSSIPSNFPPGAVGQSIGPAGIPLPGATTQTASTTSIPPSPPADHTPRFQEVEALDPHPRGKAFERLLADVLRGQGYHCDLDIIVPGEQVDLVFDDEHDSFVGEAKWEKEPIEGEVVDHLVAKLVRRSVRATGVIFSMSGFSSGAQRNAIACANVREVLLFRREEILSLIQGKSRFRDLVREKRRALTKRESPEQKKVSGQRRAGAE